MPNNHDLHPHVQQWMGEYKQTFDRVTRDIPRLESIAAIRAERDALKAERDRRSVSQDAPIHVQIVGTHPHTGEYGTIDVVDEKVTLIAPLGIGKPDMVFVLLKDCRHGMSGCYATQKDLRLVKGRD